MLLSIIQLLKNCNMSRPITQKVIFKNTSPATLYSLYMDARKHTEVTGAKAVIRQKEGATFTAYNKYITGKNLQLVKNRLIVQSWRGNDWKKTDVDSTLILRFEQKGRDTILHMVQANVPKTHYVNVKDSWYRFYWKPRKKYL